MFNKNKCYIIVLKRKEYLENIVVQVVGKGHGVAQAIGGIVPNLPHLDHPLHESGKGEICHVSMEKVLDLPECIVM